MIKERIYICTKNADDTLKVIDDSKLFTRLSDEKELKVEARFQGNWYEVQGNIYRQYIIIPEVKIEREWSITLYKNGNVRIHREIKNRLHVEDYRQVTKSSIKRIKQLSKTATIFRKRPYLSFGA